MYIDPGSGSMLVQILVASVLGIIIAFRRIILGGFAWVKSKLSPPARGNK